MSCRKADLALWINACLRYYCHTSLEPSLFLKSSGQIHKRIAFWHSTGHHLYKQDSTCMYWLSCVWCGNTLTTVPLCEVFWDSFEILCHWPPTTATAATELNNSRSYLLSLHIQLNGLWLLLISVWVKKYVSHSVRV